MKHRLSICALAASLSAALATPAAPQATEPYLGEIMIVGYTFCPMGWAEANGQLTSITENEALFSLFGTTYGGDGVTTFALPDLRGRAAADQGTGPGQPTYVQGQSGGTPTFTLTVQQMPQHTHAVMGTSSAGDAASPANGIFATFLNNVYNTAGPATVAFQPNAVGVAGSSMPVGNMQPFLTLRFCVAMQGIFPPRN